MNSISEIIADELACKPEQISAAVGLLDEGSTVPFISRYRKEVTGGLDDSQMRYLEERLRYLRELNDRKVVIISSISEQGKLSAELQRQIEQAETKNRLEDLYLPYKPKRRTKAQMAHEAGLEPLADGLLQNPQLHPEQVAASFVSKESGIEDAKSALEGARYILMERFAEDAELVGRLRDYLWTQGIVKVSVVKEKEAEGAKFKDYFAYEEPFTTIPSHRALAVFRGRNESILEIAIKVPGEPESRLQPHPCETMVAAHWNIKDQGRPADSWLHEVVRWTWRVKLFTQLTTDLLNRLREQAEREAIKVFADNLQDLLLAAPAGPRTTMGLDPGLRTGVKVAVVDGTGKLLDQTTIYPHVPKNQWQASLTVLRNLCQQHRVDLISIGNGTGSRETDKLIADLLRLFPELKLSKVVVNEAGASVYSASEFAAQEFPDLDVTIRGAVSIARRLQDPLAELVKIEPKSIGVGQYQHDVAQSDLARALDAVVEDCVNAVGVDVNTASVALLARVAGLNSALASNIVSFRDQNGPFSHRHQLTRVARLGAKTFEQSAGFLRVMNGSNPLDASAVHPEAYPLVTAIAAKHQRKVASMIGDVRFLNALNPGDYISQEFGVPTIIDIIAELKKPGRDPRPEFRFASYQEGVENLQDLIPGMVLEGVVTNVTNFGAFVDVGVHQDGLVHISALAHKFVKDPRTIVKTGDIVKVKVLEVDSSRKRIALSMRLDDDVKGADNSGSAGPSYKAQRHSADKPEKQSRNSGSGSLGALLLAAEEKLKQGNKKPVATSKKL
jgi:uncharacterized protein